MIFRAKLYFAFIGATLIIGSTPADARRDPFQESFGCRELNPLLGGGFKPNCESRWIRKLGEKVIFNVDFSTDSFGRRITPNGNSPSRTNNAIFFGCSFALGAGVNGDQTTPYYFSEFAGNTNVYNYAGSGFGPQQMLALLSATNLRSQLTKVANRTLGIYLFLDFHIQRAVGKPSIYNSFGRYFPYYHLDRENHLILDGNFESGRPVLSKLYALINKFPWLENRLERLTEAPSESDIMLTVRIIEESRRKFIDDFGSKEFVVVFFPWFIQPELPRVKKYLDARGIKYLDYSTLVNMNSAQALLGDGHPTAWVHRQVAQKLVQDLGLREKSSTLH